MSLFTDLLANPFKKDLVFLVEMSAYDLSGATTVNLFLGSDGFTSKPSDSPANQYYDERIANSLSFVRSIFNQEQIGGQSFPGYGVITFVNEDGGLDSWDDYSFDSQPVVVKMGLRTWDLADFGTIFSGTAEEVEFTESDVTLRVRDNQYKVAIPVQTNTFLGTGTWEGSADYTGRKKPFCYGECYGCEPVFIDPANLRFVLADSAIDAVLAVRDSGIPLTFSADYATKALLDAAAVPAGNYSTCLAEGLLKLGSSPAGVISVDMRGNAVGSYVSSSADIVNRLLLTRASISAGNINSASFSALNSLNSSVVGIYEKESDRTVSDVIDDLINSIGGFWGNNRSGEFIVGRFDLAIGAPVAIFRDEEIMSISRIPTGKPVYKIDLNYKKIFKLHSQTDLAAGVSAANRDLLTNEYRVSSSADLSVLVPFPSSNPLTRNSLLVSSASATTEVSRLLGIFKEKGKYYNVAIRSTPFSLDINQEIQLVTSRFGMSSGKNFIITSMEEDSGSDTIKLEVYGVQ